MCALLRESLHAALNRVTILCIGYTLPSFTSVIAIVLRASSRGYGIASMESIKERGNTLSRHNTPLRCLRKWQVYLPPNCPFSFHNTLAYSNFCCTTVVQGTLALFYEDFTSMIVLYSTSQNTLLGLPPFVNSPVIHYSHHHEDLNIASSPPHLGTLHDMHSMSLSFTYSMFSVGQTALPLLSIVTMTH